MQNWKNNNITKKKPTNERRKKKEKKNEYNKNSKNNEVRKEHVRLLHTLGRNRNDSRTSYIYFWNLPKCGLDTHVNVQKHWSELIFLKATT